MKLKKKKGFLLAEQTLKIIIALIGIIILVYLFASLYFNRVKAENQEAAYKELYGSNQLKDHLRAIKQGEYNSSEILIDRPKGWYIFSFTGSGKDREQRPNLCQGKNCICICAYEWTFFGDERKEQAIECDDSGACLIVDEPDSLKLIDYLPDEKQVKIITEGINLSIQKEEERLKIIF